MPRLICVFALRISHFVGFVMPLLTYLMKSLVYDVLFFILPRHLCRGVYSFRLFVYPFICSLVCTSVLFVELLQSFTCNQQNDLCTQRRLRTQWVAKSASFFMRTAKTDQTGQMPRLICVFLLRISHFVGFVMRLLTYWMKFLVYDVLFFILP